ncbi:MAG: stage III sporulation protein AB [Clostridiales bacterium]|nr:stage III sporulation protein AB [Clostridiales bacterium]
MIIKTIGALMTGAACIYVGTLKSSKIRKRHKNLLNIQRALELLETKITFSQRDIKTALEEIDKNIDTSGFLGEVIKNIDKSGIRNAWNGAVLKKRDDLCFNAEDADTVSMLSSRLGMTDCENQVKNIAYVKNMLDIHIKSARYDADKLCRLYSGGGLLAGAFLIMMFL